VATKPERPHPSHADERMSNTLRTSVRGANTVRAAARAAALLHLGRDGGI
jgi:hypothetical protein